ncbi:hypothetical protein TWF730_007477 [Orbilia blumenaviensis]|uniref:Uncharacterized protein n=1 Tax=Orbilia blumenaviensis TaxID=1796055 RepID=A0AAV9V851_9PEZI
MSIFTLTRYDPEITLTLIPNYLDRGGGSEVVEHHIRDRPGRFVHSIVTRRYDANGNQTRYSREVTSASSRGFSYRSTVWKKFPEPNSSYSSGSDTRRGYIEPDSTRSNSSSVNGDEQGTDAMDDPVDWDNNIQTSRRSHSNAGGTSAGAYRPQTPPLSVTNTSGARSSVSGPSSPTNYNPVYDSSYSTPYSSSRTSARLSRHYHRRSMH